MNAFRPWEAPRKVIGERAGGRKCRILVVDDERHIARFLEFVLTREGYDVRTAADGTEALQLLAVFQPDGVLLDLVLPGMDGVQVLRTIRSDPAWRHLKVLVLTARSSEALADELRQAGADAHAPKPIAPSALTRKLLELALPPEVGRPEGEA